jgi:phage recombination protein Bet
MKYLAMWEQKESLAEIKQIFAPKLTPLEFITFVEMGKTTGLNPFLKEIWAVKYDDRSPAQIFIGRDGYRKSAQRHPLYDYHNADAIYSNDTFIVRNNGEVTHTYDLKDRGNLLGGYCVVKRKESSRPMYNFVELKEYYKSQSVWKDKPATMIKKVAESQGLKAAFQELFANSYCEFEEIEKDKPIRKNGKGVEGLKEVLGITEPIVEIAEEVIEENIDIDDIKWKIETASTIKQLLEVSEKAKLLPKDKIAEIRTLYREREKVIAESIK